MKEIEALGIDIERSWCAANFREEAFADIAESAIERHPFHELVSAESLLRWLSSPESIATQAADGGFGEPAIRLHIGRRFYIEALFWNDGITAIHEHGFSGIFQVVAGGSIHTTFSFRPQISINQRLQLGELTAGPSELLSVGDTRRIVSGRPFIHSLFHLDRPSVTMVIRTDHDAGACPQLSYLPPGIAYDPFVPDARLPKLVRLLDSLQHPSAASSALLRELAETTDLHSLVLLLMHWFRTRPVDSVEADELVDAVRRRHAELADHLRVAAREARRQALVTARRRRIHHREHRFLLALLLNVGSRVQILKLIAQVYPSCNPLERITTWLEEIATTPAEDIGAGPIGYDLGEAELKVLAALLQERTPEEVLTEMRHEYEVEGQEAAILSLCKSLRTAALFEPLFRLQQ